MQNGQIESFRAFVKNTDCKFLYPHLQDVLAAAKTGIDAEVMGVPKSRGVLKGTQCYNSIYCC